MVNFLRWQPMPAIDKKQAKRLQERGELDAAFAAYSEILTEDFDDAEALYRAGLGFAARGHYGMAANIFRRAFDLSPDCDTLIDLAHCYRSRDKTSEAEKILRMALERADNDRKRSQIMGNIAGCYSNNGTPERGIELYDAAIALDPENRFHHFNKGILQLELGQWSDGFSNYQLGFETGQRNCRTYAGVKPWRPGLSLKGKTIIVWGEQGIGDEIMFASCIPDLMREAKEVIFDCHPRLVTLFERSFGIKCYGTRKDLTGFEWWRETGADMSISVASLAFLYRSNGEFPGTAYLRAHAENHGARKRIGIAWSGGTIVNKSQARTIPLIEWEPLLRSFPDAQFYSLQYQDSAAGEVAAFREQTGIDLIHYPGKVQAADYAGTADFVAGLDLVITVCTSVVHLAGALGVPCWCLTPSKPAWRYGISGRNMHWYDSVSLYRQSGDDWTPVFDEISHDLRAFIAPERKAAE